MEKEILEFTCPNCGRHILMCVERKENRKKVYFNHDRGVELVHDLTIDQGYDRHFQCLACGFKIKDEDGNLITDAQELCEWVEYQILMQSAGESTDGADV